MKKIILILSGFLWLSACQTTSSMHTQKIFKKSSLVTDTQLAKDLGATRPTQTKWQKYFNGAPTIDSKVKGNENQKSIDQLIVEGMNYTSTRDYDNLKTTLAQIDTITNSQGFLSTPSQRALRLYLEGNLYDLSQDGAKSVRFYKDAIRFDPSFSSAYIGAANAYISLSKYGLAENVLDLGFEFAKPHPSMLFTYGILRKKQNRWQEAKKWFDEAIREGPQENAGYYVHRASWHIKFNQPVKAQKDIIKANQVDPRNVDALLMSAMISINYNKNYELAKKQLIRAMRFQPMNQGVKLKVAEVLLEQNNNPEFVTKILKNILSDKNSSPHMQRVAATYLGALDLKTQPQLF